MDPKERTSDKERLTSPKDKSSAEDFRERNDTQFKMKAEASLGTSLSDSTSAVEVEKSVIFVAATASSKRTDNEGSPLCTLRASTMGLCAQGCESKNGEVGASIDCGGIPLGVGELGKDDATKFRLTQAECDSSTNVDLPANPTETELSQIFTGAQGSNLAPSDAKFERLDEKCDMRKAVSFPAANAGSHSIADSRQRLESAVLQLATKFSTGGPASLASWGIHPTLRLRGGAAETQSNGGSGGGGGGANGTAGWSSGGSGQGGGAAVGNPPPGWSQPPGNGGQQGGGGGPPPQWGSQPNGQLQGQSPNSSDYSNAGGNGGGANQGQGGAATSWAQAAGKGLPQNPGNSNNPPGVPGGGGGGNPQPSTDSQLQKRELEKIREALFATDGWGGNHVNQESDWSVPPSPPRSPGSEGQQSWKPNTNAAGTEIWENNIRNGGVAPPRAADMSASVKSPWDRHGVNNDFGGQWDPEDDADTGSNSWNNPPPGNQWGGSGNQMSWKDKSGGVDWSNPGSGGSNWGNQGGGGNRGGWNQKPNQMGGGGGGSTWGGGKPSGWGDDGVGKGGDDGTGSWGDPNGMRKKEMMGRGGMMGGGAPQSGGPGMRMPQGVRGPPPGAGGRWDDVGGGVGDSSGWSMAPSSPPGGGNPAWGKPKTGWGDPNDMMDQNPGWGAHKQRQGNWGGPSQGWSMDMAPQDQWGMQSWQAEQRRQMYKDDGMGGRDDMSDMGGYGGHRDGMGGVGGVDQSGVGLGMGSGSSGPGGWPSGGGAGRVDDPHVAAAAASGFGAGTPYDMGGGQMMGAQGRGGPGVGGFPGQMQQNVQPFMQVRSGVRPGAPSSQQLHLLVNQIHMAVQAGHLNPQILNQKLSSQTLVLLHELLNQIKILQSYTQQQQALQQQGHMRGVPSRNVLQLSVKITQTKQQIQNLQNQINAQQGIFNKPHNPTATGAPHGMMMGGAGDTGFQKYMGVGVGMGGAGAGGMGGAPGVGGHDGGFSSILNSMGNMNMTGMGGGGGGDMPTGMVMDPSRSGVSQSSSRFFNDWRMGDKVDDQGYGSEFSRAPGSTMLGASTGDDPWGTGKVDSSGGGGWPDAGSMASSGVSTSSGTATSTTTTTGGGTAGWSAGGGGSGASPGSSQSYSMPDVPEFEPGKPWKGNQLLKNIEDDPTITPGSVKRSPLSVAGIKEDLSMKAAAAATATSSGTTTTTATNVASNGSGQGQGGGQQQQPSSSGAQGLSFNSATWSYGSNRGNTWLMLNNLSPGLDGNTLKTLCVQHGPLVAFHMLPHQGMALVRYSSYEEASKAQGNLHSCVFGNTTIRADFVSDADVQAFMGGAVAANAAVAAAAAAAVGQQAAYGQQAWSAAATSQASAMAKGHEAWATQPGLATWSGAGANPSSLWDRVDSGGDPSHSYLPENLI